MMLAARGMRSDNSSTALTAIFIMLTSWPVSRGQHLVLSIVGSRNNVVMTSGFVGAFVKNAGPLIDFDAQAKCQTMSILLQLTHPITAPPPLKFSRRRPRERVSVFAGRRRRLCSHIPGAVRFSSRPYSYSYGEILTTAVPDRRSSVGLSRSVQSA